MKGVPPTSLRINNYSSPKNKTQEYGELSHTLPNYTQDEDKISIRIQELRSNLIRDEERGIIIIVIK